MNTISILPATQRHAPAISRLMSLATRQLQRQVLSAHQIKRSLEVAVIDQQLIEDGTYFVATSSGVMVACGGWSFRHTLYGAANCPGTCSDCLDPLTSSARMRAFYTHPEYVRRGIGRMLLAHAEMSARVHGYTKAKLVATLVGQPLYLSCGYSVTEKLDHVCPDGTRIPISIMRKSLLPG
ncbi:MAG: GNAT family N-acetyltransferase [Nitratireductor sp.]|nr:GNAT family N-acetyltransferase [Nitratireductor sp.]